MRWFFFDFSGCINSFGLASFVVSDMGVLLLWIAAGPSRKSIWKRLSWPRWRACMEILQISWSGDVWQGFWDISEFRGPRWRAMFQAHMARRTCFREQYYIGMRRYCWAGKIAGPDPRKLYIYIYIYIYIYMVFHWFLGIHQFVWARALCGVRYGCPAAVDCSGTAQKIHMRKTRWRQGREHAWKCCRFQHFWTFDEVLGTIQGPWQPNPTRRGLKHCLSAHVFSIE